MSGLTSRIVVFSLCLANSGACSKNNPESYETDESLRPQNQELLVPRPSPSNDHWPRTTIASAAPVDSSDAFPDPSAALECPSSRNWSKFDSFAAPCAHVWTTDAQQLPSPPQWQPCSAADGIPLATCKQWKRSRRLKTFHLGTRGPKDMQIGFVEACEAEQIVLADIDGPTRFALRRAQSAEPSTACQMKLLAIDMGQWLAAFGGHEVAQDTHASGYTKGGAFVGGTIGSAPTVLFSQTSETFHVATSQGIIVPDGWNANGKRRSWNGKPFEPPPRIGLIRITKRILLDEKKGFYEQTRTDPKLLFEPPPGSAFVSAQVRDKQIVWQEQSGERTGKTCTLMAADLDADERLTTPRRIAEIPCSSSKFILGCHAALINHDSYLSLISLTNGTSRTLRIKGRPVAIDCQEAFVDRAGTLLRIDVTAFGPAKAPALPILSPPTTKKK